MHTKGKLITKGRGRNTPLIQKYSSVLFKMAKMCEQRKSQTHQVTHHTCKTWTAWGHSNNRGLPPPKPTAVRTPKAYSCSHQGLPPPKPTAVRTVVYCPQSLQLFAPSKPKQRAAGGAAPRRDSHVVHTRERRTEAQQGVPISGEYSGRHCSLRTPEGIHSYNCSFLRKYGQWI